MGSGVEESREHGYRQHQERQEEEAGRRKRQPKQRDTPTREAKEEGHATREIQEEQGETRQIWKESATVRAPLGQDSVWPQTEASTGKLWISLMDLEILEIPKECINHRIYFFFNIVS